MAENFYTLETDEQITSIISRRQCGQLALVVVEHPQVRAVVCLQGAQLLSWQPVGEKEVIWLSDNTPFRSGVAVRGGVPVCWPWFGNANVAGLPSHGFARNLRWQLCAHQQNEQGVMLTFELHNSEASQRYWPHDFTLYARFRLATQCDIELEAHGNFTTTAALHSYFQVGNSRAVQVSGLGQQFIDKVKHGRAGELTSGVQDFLYQIDRVYLNPEVCSLIEDAAWSRVIEVTHQHHSNVVVWNPGPEVTASMQDMQSNAWQQFVCVETACVTQPQITRYHKPSRLACSFRVRGM